MLPERTWARVMDEGSVLGLKFREGSDVRVYYLRLLAREGPNNLRDFSLGSAAAQSTTGTGWSSIQDSASRYILEPESEGDVYQGFYGISPSSARIFRRWPSNVDRGSLRTARTVGGDTGYIAGEESPARFPQPETEFFTVKRTYPDVLGYHPYALPANITIRLNFYIFRFESLYLGRTDPLLAPVRGKATPAPDDVRRARVVTVGGVDPLVEAPDWLREKD